MKAPGMTAGQLRAALQGVPDSTEVTVRTTDEGEWGGCGGILSASVEVAHDDDDTEFFAIDCSSDDEDFE